MRPGLGFPSPAGSYHRAPRPTATAEGGPELDDGPLPEVPDATLLIRKDVSTTKAAALVGVGAAVGWGAARRRR